jgi:hypothetical protein
MTENTTPIEDREANIKERVRHIIERCYDQMFDAFDRLHKRNIHDDDVVSALRSLGENDILDQYAEWADIDLREDNNTTLDPVVPDPGEAPSYKALGEALGRSALNATLRNAHTNRVGVTEDEVQFLRKRLPAGSRVGYWPNEMDARWTEAVTSSEVYVQAGVPVVDLASGRTGIRLHQLQVIS